MDFLKLAADRYSVRAFDGRCVSPEHMEKILRAGHLAPTACNNQPQRIIVVQGKEALAKLQACTRCHFDAPTVLMVCFDREKSWKRTYDGKDSGDIDAAIVTTHMMLEAAALGVGSTWVMHFRPAELRTAFALPDRLEPTALLVMGYPAADAEKNVRHDQFRPMEEIVSYDQL